MYTYVGRILVYLVKSLKLQVISILDSVQKGLSIIIDMIINIARKTRLRTGFLITQHLKLFHNHYE